MTKIEILDVLKSDRREEAWQLYQRAFEHLNALTVQRHLMYRSEFDDVAGDVRIQKWIVVDEAGSLLGLATYTNILEAWPLISPAYFERRWPMQYALGRIWYCGFVAVPNHNHGVFIRLIAKMYEVAEQADGVIGLDVCQYNEEVHQLGRAVKVSLTRISDGQVEAELADRQNFFIYRAHNPAVATAVEQIAGAPIAEPVEAAGVGGGVR